MRDGHPVGAQAAGEDRVEELVARARDAREEGDWKLAASTYLDAARAAGAEDPAARARAGQLELAAANCHIHAGALGTGWQLIKRRLDEVGVQTPSSPAKALLGTSWRRGRFLLRKLGGQDHAEPSVDERSRMELLDAAARSLTLVHTGLGDSLRTMYLNEVSRWGTPSEYCRALAGEVAMLTRIGSPFDKPVRKILERCTQLAEQSGDPLDRAWLYLAHATHEFSHGRWRACVEACESANEFLNQAQASGDLSHERARVDALHWFALAWLGELETLRERLDRVIADAQERHDGLALLEALSGQAMLVWLAADEVDRVRERTAAVLADHAATRGAPWPDNAYRRQHYRDLMAEIHASLYRGDPVPAWAALVAQWRELESAFYIPMRTLAVEIRTARARVALALAEQLDRDRELTVARLQAAGVTGSWDRARLLGDVRSVVEFLRRESSCVAPSLASLLEAGLDALEGRREQAQVGLDAAMRGFNSVDMALHRECARHALGELIGGAEGGQMQDQADAWMRRQKVVYPRKLAASQAPGFGLAGTS